MSNVEKNVTMIPAALVMKHVQALLDEAYKLYRNQRRQEYFRGLYTNYKKSHQGSVGEQRGK